MRIYFQFSLPVNYIIEKKGEPQLEKAMHDIGINFHFFEVQGNDDKSSIKWSSLDGTFNIESLIMQKAQYPQGDSPSQIRQISYSRTKKSLQMKK